MKKISPNVLVALMAVGMLAACTKSELSEDIPETTNDSTVVSTKTKKFTFTLKGDFTSEWKMVNKAPHRTAGYLAADGKDMTDVWVLDYVGGVLQQQLHQDDNTAEDFGQPTMNLAYGNHHVYFIASRGQSPTLDTENHLVTFTKVLDTFYKDYEVSVVSTSNGNRAVTLDRVITRLRLTFTDAVDAEAATINITPHTWYYGWDYVNGVPADTKTDYTTTIDIPSNKLGTTGLQVNLYGFSSATQWTTDVSVNSKKADQTVIGSATISDVPLKANRISELSGPLFSSGGAMTLSLNSTWDDAYEGTW
jgi:hypothetical protein